MEKYKLILASSSPRRIEMLRKNGIDPVIIPPDVDEDLPLNMDPKEAVMHLALKKARYVETIAIDRYSKEPSLVIGADTVVYLDRIIGKPKDREEAFAILDHLRGREHFVATGVAILKAGTGERKVFCDITKVFFKNYSDEDIRAYIDTEEPYDKAGGYAIQGAWGKMVTHIIGDFNNVMGFPWTRIKQELDQF
ncbi:MAG: septum formation protein Maf [Clostridiales bacterium]|nr:septum formation protein Maf [Clostridiales bacterium]